MTNAELTANKIITGERNYEAALALVIAAAQHELLIFDQDFTKGDFASNERFVLLQEFLSKNSNNKLTIILQNTQFFINNCPRILALLSTYSHRMTVYETNETAKIAKECFVIADRSHYCQRFHIDQARFKYGLNKEDLRAEDLETTAGLLMRYDALLAETTSALSNTKLGL